MNTEIYQEKDRPVIGYVLNVPLSSENQTKMALIQEKLQADYKDALWLTPPQNLHITLMDWLAPLVDYGKDKDLIFNEIFNKYDIHLQKILSSIKSFSVKFDTILVSPSAIFVTGEDTGEFEYIRNTFTKEIILLPGTKQPPKIVHFTIARFRKMIPLETVTELVSKLSVDFSQEITNFRLLREEKIPLLTYSEIKNYSLK